MDLAASIQAVTEEIVLRIGAARPRADRHEESGPGRRRRAQLRGQRPAVCAKGRSTNIWIQPAAGDAGGALGAALFVWHQLLEKPAHRAGQRQSSRAASSGPRFTTDEIARSLTRQGRHVPALRRRSRAAASTSPRCWPTDKVVGWFQGRMEFGPRALGARSILGDPRSPDDAGDDEPEDQVPRELPAVRPGRPAGTRRRVVRPATRARRARTCCWSPRCGEDRRDADRPADAADDAGRPGSAQPRQRRALDDPGRHPRRLSARASRRWTSERNPRFHRLLEAFDRLTGCPVLVNTSFNVRGEPIVCTPRGCLPLLPGDRHGRAGARRHRDHQGCGRAPGR